MHGLLINVDQFPWREEATAPFFKADSTERTENTNSPTSPQRLLIQSTRQIGVLCNLPAFNAIACRGSRPLDLICPGGAVGWEVRANDAP